MELSEHQSWANTTIGDAYPYVNQGLARAVEELLAEVEGHCCGDSCDKPGCCAPGVREENPLVKRVREELRKQRLISAVLYCGLGLAGEAGEVANKMKKVLRDDDGMLRPERVHQLMKELGGTLWYWMQACTTLGLDAGQVAAANRHEIEGRLRRGTLKGDGDDR